MNLTVNPNRIRVGVVGLGRSGYGIHLKALKKLQQSYELVAVADSWSERRIAVANEYGVNSYDSIETLVRDPQVELVTIAVPNHLHVPQALTAIAAGKHVICEKPFGTSSQDADLMIGAAHAAGVRLVAFHNRRYEATFQKICSVISSRVLGRIVQMRMNWSAFIRRWDWQTLNEFEGGQLNNNGPHAVDQALHLLAAAGVEDEEKLAVTAEMKQTIGAGDAEDHVRVTFRDIRQQMTLDLELFSTQAFTSDRWTVCGTLGALRGDMASVDWKWLEPQNLVPREADRLPFVDRSYCQEELPWNNGRYDATDKFSDWARLFYEEHVSCLRFGHPPAISTSSARAVTRMIERIRECCRV
jgi:scyllo-inositol 2-dehydrogenase (NADP+)